MPLGLSPLHLLVILAIYALPVAFVVLLVMAVRRRPPDPRAVLAARLARGEITREQFDTAMVALGFAPEPPPPSAWGNPPNQPNGS
jgi:hypothetical protein